MVGDPPPNDAALADEARNVSVAGEHADQASNLPNTSVEDRYWKTGILGTIFQTFLDASLIVERSDLSKDNKAVEKAKILEARKHAFGQHFRNYPPWK